MSHDAPLEILILNWQDRLHPQAGGAERHLHEIFGRLASRGHRITLLCCGWAGAPGREIVDGIQVIRVGDRRTYPLHVRRAYRGLRVNTPFDVVIEDLNKVSLLTPRWVEEPLIVLFHHLFGSRAFRSAGLAEAAAAWLGELPLGRVYGDTPTVAVSESTRDELIAKGFAPGGVRIVHNGVDSEYFTPDPAMRDPQPTLLFVGRLAAIKRVDLLLRATALIRREHGIPATLLVAGTGPLEGQLRKQEQSLGLGEGVRFLGRVTEDEKRDLYRRAWVHLLTSEKEGWGLTVMEAAACGTLTVGSNVSGLRDSVRDGETGVLVPHGDVGALAREVARLLEDAPRREEMGHAARLHSERFTWEDAAVRMEGVIREVAG